MFAVVFPFHLEGQNKEKVHFNISFDVIEGDLPFLIGWPSLRAMKANINCEHMNLGVRVNDGYHRLKLHTDDDHVYLPFKSRSSFAI